VIDGSNVCRRFSVSCDCCIFQYISSSMLYKLYSLNGVNRKLEDKLTKCNLIVIETIVESVN
jgi:hypothetical protein